MSIFTSLSHDQIVRALAHYNIGELTGYQDLVSGTDQFSCHLSTSQGEFVLTLLEHFNNNDLDQCLNLINYLQSVDIPCPPIISTNNGDRYPVWEGKALILTARIPGERLVETSRAQCAAVGALVAKIHQVGQHYPVQLRNRFGFQWRIEATLRLADALPNQERTLLHDELAYQIQQGPHYLLCPRGLIHGNIFRDQVLFKQDQLEAVLDFDYACYDKLLFDVAILINDWCFNQAGDYLPEHATALLQAYEEVRPLEPIERQQLSACCRAACLRFWLSRLQAHQNKEQYPQITHKDPQEYVLKLKWHRQQPLPPG